MTDESSREGLGDSLEAHRRYVQYRVAQASRLATLLWTAMLLLRIAETWLAHGYAALFSLTITLHLLSAVTTAGIWAASASRRFSLSAIWLLEGTGQVVVTLWLVALWLSMPMTARPDLLMVPALTLLHVGRAVFIPCTARRTLTVSLISALVGLCVQALMLRGLPLATVVGPDIGLGHWQDGALLLILCASTSFWWVLMITLAVITSRTIYGLRDEAQRARELGRYRLGEKLGAGGMGIVYRARHGMLRRPTAVKMLSAADLSEDRLLAFEREVQLTAELTHPNTVTIFDYGRAEDGSFYYAMEYLPGLNLQQIIDGDGPQPWGRVVAIVRQVAGSLREAHERGLLHGDVKPANIMLSDRGGRPDFATLLDFGLARTLKTRTEPLNASASSSSAGAITAGTPQYLAPEAILEPDDADERSDIYALATMTYTLLCGRPPFSGTSASSIMDMQLHAPVPPLPGSCPAPLPEGLVRLVTRALDKSPAARPQSIAEFLGELEQIPSTPVGPGAFTEADARRWWTDYHQRKTHRQAAAEYDEVSTITVTRRRPEKVSQAQRLR